MMSGSTDKCEGAEKLAYTPVGLDIIGLLPIEIALQIVSHLEPVEIFRFRIVSRKWQSLLSSDLCEDTILRKCFPTREPFDENDDPYNPCTTLKEKAETRNAYRRGLPFDRAFRTAYVCQAPDSVYRETHLLVSYCAGKFAWIAEGGYGDNWVHVCTIFPWNEHFWQITDEENLTGIVLTCTLVATISADGCRLHVTDLQKDGDRRVVFPYPVYLCSHSCASKILVRRMAEAGGGLLVYDFETDQIYDERIESILQPEFWNQEPEYFHTDKMKDENLSLGQSTTHCQVRRQGVVYSANCSSGELAIGNKISAISEIECSIEAEPFYGNVYTFENYYSNHWQEGAYNKSYEALLGDDCFLIRAAPQYIVVYCFVKAFAIDEQRIEQRVWADARKKFLSPQKASSEDFCSSQKHGEEGVASE